MSRKVKHSFEFKLAVVKEVLKGDRSVSSVSADRHVDRPMVQRWVRFYKRFGKQGLLPQSNNTYSLETKLSAVNILRDKRLTLSEVCLQFGIRTGSVLSRWVRIYESQGVKGLAIERRATGKVMASNKSKKKTLEPLTDYEKILEQNRRLLTENAYLKKLHALIQKEAAEQRKKR